jgi:hypothetical protein
VKTLAIIAALLIRFVLLVPHAALAHWLDEATALNQQVIQLYNQGRFSEALPLAQRALAMQEQAVRGAAFAIRGHSGPKRPRHDPLVRHIRNSA